MPSALTILRTGMKRDGKTRKPSAEEEVAYGEETNQPWRGMCPTGLALGLCEGQSGMVCEGRASWP